MQGANVRLINLPQNEIYVKISETIKSRLSQLRKKKFKNMKKLADVVNEHENALINFFWYRRAHPLRVFIKLVNYFKIEDYEKEIKWIGGKTKGCGITNPKLPFNFSTREGGMFIAAILGDGSFLKNLEVEYRNYCPLMLNILKNTSNKLFGKVKLVREDETSIMFPVIIGKILRILKLRPGRKTVTNPSIPKFIMNGSKECQIGFLQQITDDEASPQIKPPYSYSIRYEFALEIPKEKFKESEKYVPNLLLDLYKIFRNRGYSLTNIYGGRVYKGKKKPRYCVSWVFDIQGKKSLEKFAKEINLRIPKRKKKLVIALKEMKIETYGKRAKKVVLKEFYKILNKKDFVTKYELAKSIKRTLRNAQDWLSKLKREHLIKKIGGNEFIGGGFKGLCGRSPARYTITKKGIRLLNKFRKEENKIIIKKLPKWQ